MENSESSPKINNSDSKPTTNWRDVLPIHPACELFPKMSESELDDLAEDIRKNGMRISPVIFAEPGPTKKSPAKYSLIDGYNRLAALKRLLHSASSITETTSGPWTPSRSRTEPLLSAVMKRSSMWSQTSTLSPTSSALMSIAGT